MSFGLDQGKKNEVALQIPIVDTAGSMSSFFMVVHGGFMEVVAEEDLDEPPKRGSRMVLFTIRGPARPASRSEASRLNASGAWVVPSRSSAQRWARRRVLRPY